MPLADGQQFADYTIVRRLGAGGMGEVYLARHPRLPRHDALKVLPTEVSTDDEYRRRFEQEADIAATLWHPHIVTVHDRGEYEGQLWISMDYVAGTDAGRLLSEQYPNGIPPVAVIRIVTAVADALDHAHQRNLLHRDVKPANILLADDNGGGAGERVLLADFGIARWTDRNSGLTETDMTVGTVAYAAPEQLRAERIDGRADQYALAATAFQLMTGEPPFRHSNPAVVISQHLTAEPPAIGDRRPELSDLDPVFAKALAKDPGDRYDRCIDFARALEHRYGGVERVGVDQPTQLALPTTGKRRRRPAVIIAAAAALAGVGVGAAVLLTMQHGGEGSASEAAPTSPTAPTVPVVMIGADCATLGAAGITEDGDRAYCAHLPTVDADIWSLYPGRISHPTVTRDPGAEPLPADEEAPVLVCVEQTGQSALECHEDIQDANDPDDANTPTS
ncbi:serine/threonine-protein kinase [Mycolicibacterium thermoresistibile]